MIPEKAFPHLSAHGRQAIDFEPGGVRPFGIDGGIRILIDDGLAQYPTIYRAGETRASGVVLIFAQLLLITGGQTGDFSMVEKPGSDRQPEEGLHVS